MRLSERLESFWIEHPVGSVLDEEQVEALAKKAIRFYAGYSELVLYREIGVSHESIAVDPDTCTTESEWALIRPLFDLYREFENAVALEATRGLGLDVYGRSTSEIQADIATIEDAMALRAFCMEVITV